MKSASVSKLKATLSACLAWVKAGEEVMITERGKPIAKIIPLINIKIQLGIGYDSIIWKT